MAAAVALATSPSGFTAGEFAAKVREVGGEESRAYSSRKASYDLRKLRGKKLIGRMENRTRRYRTIPDGVRTMAALSVLREKIIKPLLAGFATRKSSTARVLHGKLDQRYQAVRAAMSALFNELGLAV